MELKRIALNNRIEPDTQETYTAKQLKFVSQIVYHTREPYECSKSTNIVRDNFDFLFYGITHKQPVI